MSQLGRSELEVLWQFFCFHSMGAPLMVELEGETDPLKIAMKELKYVWVEILFDNEQLAPIIDSNPPHDRWARARAKGIL